MVGDNLQDLATASEGKSPIIIPIPDGSGGVRWLPDDSFLAGQLALQILRSRWPNHAFYANGMPESPPPVVEEPKQSGSIDTITMPPLQLEPSVELAVENNRLLGELIGVIRELINNNKARSNGS